MHYKYSKRHDADAVRRFETNEGLARPVFFFPSGFVFCVPDTPSNLRVVGLASVFCWASSACSFISAICFAYCSRCSRSDGTGRVVLRLAGSSSSPGKRGESFSAACLLYLTHVGPPARSISCCVMDVDHFPCKFRCTTLPVAGSREMRGVRESYNEQQRTESDLHLRCPQLFGVFMQPFYHNLEVRVGPSYSGKLLGHKVSAVNGEGGGDTGREARLTVRRNDHFVLRGKVLRT
jgi:hypothetical protein